MEIINGKLHHYLKDKLIHNSLFFLCLNVFRTLIYIMKGGEKDGRVDQDDR